jgi:hypothetical protein
MQIVIKVQSYPDIRHKVEENLLSPLSSRSVGKGGGGLLLIPHLRLGSLETEKDNGIPPANEAQPRE